MLEAANEQHQRDEDENADLRSQLKTANSAIQYMSETELCRNCLSQKFGY